MSKTTMHDITIIFKVGDALAYAKSGSQAGRNFLSDNVQGRRIHNTALVKSEDLLLLLEQAMRLDLSIFWRKE
jgi:hypothetical protein